VNLSVKSDYAARAVLGLARAHATGASLRAEDLAGSEGVPGNYLAQILAELRARGIVRSLRGKSGGYLLARPPEAISLGDVLRATQGAVVDTSAVSGAHCPPELKRAWDRFRRAAEVAADGINFRQLLDERSDKEKMYHI